jgi:CheY-like chemotaxis protein
MLVPESKTNSTATNPAPTAKTGRRSFAVLVIDDNEVDRQLTTALLAEAWPFERDMAVDTAGDGREALEKMRTTRFALIVLDWKLPLVGGSEVLRSMRRNGIFTPVVVLSGLERTQIHEDLESLGAAYLNKAEMSQTSLYDAIARSLRLLGLTQPIAADKATDSA